MSHYLNLRKELHPLPPTFQAIDYAKGLLYRDILTVPDIKDIIDKSDSDMSLAQDTEDLAIYVLQSPHLPTTLPL